jgi:hypothetical protein
MPVVALQSTYRCRVLREDGSGGAMSSAASASMACWCVLLSGDAMVGRSGEQDCVVLALMRTWSKWP